MLKNACEFQPPWPDLVIASGRAAVLPARYIKKQAGSTTFVTFLQDPRIAPQHFDLVAAPAHDALKGDNVITTTAAPNAITSARLEQARNDFEHTLGHLPTPRVAVLIGGNSRTHRLSRARMREIATLLRGLTDRYGAGLMITMSRRSPEGTDAILRECLNDTNTFIWDGQADNPYMGMLALADHILVTEDSTSMMAEAASTGTPVYRIPLAGGSPKFDRLYANLENCLAVRKFNGTLQAWTYPPLDDAGLVAKAIQENLACTL
jgi:hypothetical protein